MELIKDIKTDKKVSFQVNTIVAQAGNNFETWLKIGDKMYLTGKGTFEEMSYKKDKIRRFLNDKSLWCGIKEIKDIVTVAQKL